MRVFKQAACVLNSSSVDSMNVNLCKHEKKECSENQNDTTEENVGTLY
jgi:hypothetical protein